MIPSRHAPHPPLSQPEKNSSIHHQSLSLLTKADFQSGVSSIVSRRGQVNFRNLTPTNILALQQTIGNQAVRRRVLQNFRPGDSPVALPQKGPVIQRVYLPSDLTKKELTPVELDALRVQWNMPNAKFKAAVADQTHLDWVCALSAEVRSSLSKGQINKMSLEKSAEQQLLEQAAAEEQAKVQAAEEKAAKTEANKKAWETKTSELKAAITAKVSATAGLIWNWEVNFNTDIAKPEDWFAQVSLGTLRMRADELETKWHDNANEEIRKHKIELISKQFRVAGKKLNFRVLDELKIAAKADKAKTPTIFETEATAALTLQHNPTLAKWQKHITWTPFPKYEKLGTYLGYTSHFTIDNNSWNPPGPVDAQDANGLMAALLGGGR